MTDVQTNPLFEIFAKVSLGLDDVKKEIQRQTDWNRMARAASTPSFFDIVGSQVAPTANFVLSDNSMQNGPTQGYVWLIRSITIADLGTAFDAAVTIGAVVLITPMSSGGIASATDPKLFSTAVDNLTPTTGTSFGNPISKVYSNEQLACYMGENLHVAILGATVGHQYSVRLRGVQYQEAAYKQVMTL